MPNTFGPVTGKYDYMKARPYETAFAFVFLFSALIYFIPGLDENASTTAIYTLLKDYHYLVPIWNGMWLLGGACTLFGLAFPLSRFYRGPIKIDGIGIELAGVIFATSALVIYMIAIIVATHGITPALSILIALVMAGIYRAYSIISRPKHFAAVPVPGTPLTAQEFINLHNGDHDKEE
jgi:hypothetical protein